MSEDARIESMPLYTHLERIGRGLAASGIKPTDPIPPERLCALDQWHYHGTEAIRAAGFEVASSPEHSWFMKPLVVALSESLQAKKDKDHSGLS